MRSITSTLAVELANVKTETTSAIRAIASVLVDPPATPAPPPSAGQASPTLPAPVVVPGAPGEADFKVLLKQAHSALVNAQALLIKVITPSLSSTFNSIKEEITSTLDGMPNRAYIYAVNTWNPNALSAFDPVIREFTKGVLRDYFEARGKVFDGWAATA